MQAIDFAILGLGTGALYALSALGLVVTFRASGTLNFAQGAMGMAGAFVCYNLWLHSHWPVVAAVVVGVAVGALLGAAVHVLIMRPLRNAAELTRLIATLGVLIALQYGFAAKYGVTLELVQNMLPESVLEPVSGIHLPANRAILIGLSIVLTLALTAIYRRTKFGLATTAVAENPQAVAALGRSADVIAAANWGIGGALAAFVAILVAPIVGLDVTQLTFLVMPALAAAIVGRLSSFGLTFVAAMAIGVAQSEATLYLPVQGLSASIPFVAVILVLVLGGRGLPQRGESAPKLPELGSGMANIWMAGILTAVAAVLVLILPVEWVEAIITSALFAMVLLSLVVVTGFAGQLSLAQFVLAGVGGFVASTLASTYGWPLELAAPAGVLATIVIGALVGLPALRTRGVNLAVVTLGLGTVIENMVLTNTSLTGGGAGLKMPPIHLFGFDFTSAAHPQRYAMLVLGALAALLALVANLRRSAAGRRLIAVRSNERAAAALGINLTVAKLYAFSFASAVAGVAGVLIVYQFQYVDFLQFSTLSSINAVVDAVIGGIGFVSGALWGAALAPGGIGLQPFKDSQSLLHILETLIGVMLLVTLLANPNGIAKAANPMALVRRVRRRSARRPQPPVLPDVVPVRVPTADLDVRDLTVRFGGVVALSDAHLRVKSGEVVGLIGPNGAGKSTLIDAVSGFVRGDGEVLLNGRDLASRQTHARLAAGISRSFQSLELFEDISVLDNLRVASSPRGWRQGMFDLVWPRPTRLTPTAVAAAHEFELGSELLARPGDLPFGKRRLVAIARAVASGPSILLLDEPAAGLDEEQRVELADLIVRLARDWGMGVLLVEHDVDLVVKVCDRITVLDFGKVLATGTASEIREDPAVVAAYLGEGDPVEEVVR